MGLLDFFRGLDPFVLGQWEEMGAMAEMVGASRRRCPTFFLIGPGATRLLWNKSDGPAVHPHQLRAAWLRLRPWISLAEKAEHPISNKEYPMKTQTRQRSGGGGASPKPAR